MRSFCIAAVAAGALLVLLLPAAANAHPPSTPAIRYSYGVGPHDFRPHWHTTYSPWGSSSWYGLGIHDVVPHSHYRPVYRYDSCDRPYSSYRYDLYSPYYGSGYYRR